MLPVLPPSRNRFPSKIAAMPPIYRALDNNLTVLSEAEKAALYGLPDFDDDSQRSKYFELEPEQRTVVERRPGVPEQLVCILQIAFFKAKQAFFKFQLKDVAQEDIDFLMQRYFPDRVLRRWRVRKAEFYLQRK